MLCWQAGRDPGIPVLQLQLNWTHARCLPAPRGGGGGGGGGWGGRGAGGTMHADMVAVPAARPKLRTVGLAVIAPQSGCK